jgi:DNA-binding NarL/FixJ family response regulator
MTLRCLIVDDSTRFLEAARGHLEREGIIVVGVASSITQALLETERLRPDVTLVDIDLAGESGFELARRLQQAAGSSPARVILVSTHTEDDFADLIAASPAVGFLSKADLSAGAIRDLLGLEGDGAAGRANGPPGT